MVRLLLLSSSLTAATTAILATTPKTSSSTAATTPGVVEEELQMYSRSVPILTNSIQYSISYCNFILILSTSTDVIEEELSMYAKSFLKHNTTSEHWSSLLLWKDSIRMLKTSTFSYHRLDHRRAAFVTQEKLVKPTTNTNTSCCY